jgi:hypothetical protein
MYEVAIELKEGDSLQLFSIKPSVVADLLDKGVNTVRVRDQPHKLYVWGNRFIEDQQQKILVSHEGQRFDFTAITDFANSLDQP